MGEDQVVGGDVLQPGQVELGGAQLDGWRQVQPPEQRQRRRAEVGDRHLQASAGRGVDQELELPRVGGARQQHLRAVGQQLRQQGRQHLGVRPHAVDDASQAQGPP